MKLFRDCLRLLEELQILNVTNARIPPKLFQNLASLKDFLTKYSKVIRVYTINANRGDQNPLDITLGQRAPFSNVFILDSVRSAQTMDQSMRALPVTSRVNIV